MASEGMPARQFVQLAPANREERVSLWSKESLEKYRLKNRREKHMRIDQLEHPLYQVGHLNNAYATNTEIFERDSAAKEFDARIAKHQAYEKMLLARRSHTLAREAARLAESNDKFERNQTAMQRLQQRPIHLRNRGGEEYNILTSAYNPTPGGETIRAKPLVNTWSVSDMCNMPPMKCLGMDDAVREKSLQRTALLYAKSHCVKHDIITGLDLPQLISRF